MALTVEISPTEVARRLRAGEDPYFLDVRPTDAFERWHIDGSHPLPIYDELAAGDASSIEARLDEFPEDREIVVVCNTGNKSWLAAEVLREHGFVAHSMADGMHGWGAVYEAYDVPGTPVTQVLRPGTGCLSYLVSDAGAALVVDPGMHLEEYRRLLDDRDLRLVGVADTHAHADHVSGGPELAAEFGVPYFLPPADAYDRDGYAPIADGDEIAVGSVRVEVIATPGHTRGSVCLRPEGSLLTGDTLFVRSVGRPDLEGDADAARDGANRLFESLERLGGLPDSTLVLPGHFSTEPERPVAASLGEVAAGNRLLGIADREAFVEAVLADLPERPANYTEIKAINTGAAEPGADVAVLELGPNNCASD